MENNEIFMENLNSNDESQKPKINIPYYIMRCSNNSRCYHVYVYLV